jgi:uncharacterized membrane protein
MAKDVGDAIGAALGHAAREVVESVTANAKKGSKKAQMPQLSGGKGMAAGAGLVALVPLAAKGGKLVLHGLRNGTNPLQAAGDKVSGTVSDAVNKKVQEAGGPGGIAKEAAKGMLPFGGGGDDDDDEDGDKKKGGGIGHGRRMPVQQAVDVAAPIDEVYEKWTQYEEWPKFMHRLDRASQEDDTTVSFKAKIWGISREFKAEIIDEQEGELIKWRVTQGVSHNGIVTFHELGPRLTRVDVDIDIQPGGMIEKMGRGMRHAKRAVRADLHRFKAHVELEDDEDEQNGEEQEDQEQQEQQEPQDQEQEEPQDEQDEQDEPEQEQKPRRRAAAASGSGSSRSTRSASGRSSSRSSGGSKSTGGSSKSSGGSSRSSGGSSRSSSSKSTGGSSRSSGGSGRSSSSKSSGGSSRSSSSKSSGGSNGSRASSSRSGGGSNGASASRSSSSRSRSSSSNGSSASRSGGGSRRKSASSKS